MNLTPAEQEALDNINGAPRTVHTIISGFESDTDAVFLLIPAPHGREHAVGDRVTITFEENR